VIQRSFSSGEVDPALYGRADVDRWKAALQLCKNWVVQPEGGIIVRQGFELKARVAYTSAATVRLVPFEFGPDDSYVQVFTDGYMSLLDNGVLVTGDIMVSVSLNRGTTPWTVTHTAHGYATGDTVTFYDGTLKGASYVITKTTNDAYTLNTTAATSGTETMYVRRTALVSGSVPTVRYLISATFDFVDGRYVQSGDTQYFTDGNGTYNPRSLVRNFYTGVDRALCFTTDSLTGYPTFATVASLSVTGSAGTDQMRYRISYTDKDGVESAVIRTALTTASAITGTTTITVTSNSHGLITNDTIYIGETLTDDYGNVSPI
jgi:hypothetical protein